MHIIVNGKEAVLKKGVSFEYISENRFFTGADSYSLSIAFPLAGCQQNIDIFGYINRMDCDLDNLLLECEIHDVRFHAYGSISIVDISEVEVKTQFLQGKSATNFYSGLDDFYINDLQLPSLYCDGHWGADYYLRSYAQQKSVPADYLGFVCFPYVNNTSGNIQNPMSTINGGSFTFTERGNYDDAPLVGMPFLVEVIRQVLTRAEYSFDIAPIENSQWANIVVCNALPRVWGMTQMHHILPHWTISEFLEQVELFIGGEFIIDEKIQKVTFRFHNDTLMNLPTVELANVIDTFKVEISKDENSSSSNSYYEIQNLAYADCSHRMWPYYSCSWITRNMTVRTWQNVATMKRTLDSYLTCAGKMSHSYYKSVHYCKDQDAYIALVCYQTTSSKGIVTHHLRYQNVNMFREKVFDEKAQNTELNIVPAWIDYTNNTKGDMLFIECGTLDDDTEDEESNVDQTSVANRIIAGEKERRKEFFDKLYVGFWDGNIDRYAPYMPHPFVDKVDFKADNTFVSGSYSMRLSGIQAPPIRQTKHQVEQKYKYSFTFLADAIPEINNIFVIHGKRYLAEKITATFTEDGMSQLMKMVAYRLND